MHTQTAESSDTVADPDASSGFSLDFCSTRLWEHTDGYSHPEIKTEYLALNPGFVDTMERLHMLLTAIEITAEDTQYLQAQKDDYYKRQICRNESRRMPEDLFGIVLKTDFGKTVKLAKSFCGRHARLRP